MAPILLPVPTLFPNLCLFQHNLHECPSPDSLDILASQVEVARELGLSKDDAERKPRAKPKSKAKANGRKRPSSAAAASPGDDDEEGDWGDEPYEAPKAKRRRRAKAAAAASPEAPREDLRCSTHLAPAVGFHSWRATPSNTVLRSLECYCAKSALN